jgi:hypothetical protein
MSFLYWARYGFLAIFLLAVAYLAFAHVWSERAKPGK